MKPLTEQERIAHMRGVSENPDDDGSRLIFADRLEEGDENDRLHAELIRLQCSLPGFVPRGTIYERTRKRERFLLKKLAPRLVLGVDKFTESRINFVRMAIIQPPVIWGQTRTPSCLNYGDISSRQFRQLSVERGFGDSLTCIEIDLCRSGRRLFDLMPLRRIYVRVTNVPEIDRHPVNLEDGDSLTIRETETDRSFVLTKNKLHVYGHEIEIRSFTWNREHEIGPLRDDTTTMRQSGGAAITTMRNRELQLVRAPSPVLFRPLTLILELGKRLKYPPHEEDA